MGNRHVPSICGIFAIGVAAWLTFSAQSRHRASERYALGIEAEPAAFNPALGATAEDQFEAAR
jgi:hypothetical protein